MRKENRQGIVIQNRSLDVIKNVIVVSAVIGAAYSIGVLIGYGIVVHKMFKSEKSEDKKKSKKGLDNFETVKTHLEYPSEFVEDELRKHTVTTENPLVDHIDDEDATYIKGRLVNEDGEPIEEGDILSFIRDLKDIDPKSKDSSKKHSKKSKE